ncbi:hypothetical protein EV198_0394 [Roseivirga ehrenbergii]|uniref:Uncharacterized protein n=1 Tax=Roseivirga ehrenbergii (strain DSM 102268 / JCM 13514 / KCTC 12282 / NCIMB 14502 / KMM 6017) TaxID=279360 RepID=A0A150X8R9_ROSEK|nr:hypothetical protein [Roseivirga ehrenbergii]KYG75074.1 hypothetical protein MB14_07730 [Roseivirga ehrenbergii]TCL13565.1 hypothetical protein EV198_0394 [Roseivirga ehrenbergii]
MSRAKLIDYYIEKSQSPDFQIDQIRKELEPNNIPEEDIRAIVKLVDNHILNSAFTKNSKNRSTELIIAGAILALLGVGVTIATYTGLINLGDNFLVVYGPFFGGVSMLFGGLAQRKNSSSKIRSNRQKLDL